MAGTSSGGTVEGGEGGGVTRTVFNGASQGWFGGGRRTSSKNHAQARQPLPITMQVHLCDNKDNIFGNYGRFLHFDGKNCTWHLGLTYLRKRPSAIVPAAGMALLALGQRRRSPTLRPTPPSERAPQFQAAGSFRPWHMLRPTPV